MYPLEIQKIGNPGLFVKQYLDFVVVVRKK